MTWSRIDLADRGRHAPVERLERGVVLLPVVEGRNRLVQQLVREHGRLRAVPLRDPAPHQHHPILRLSALEQPRRAGAVVDVRARLAAGGAVHVEHHPEAQLARPANHAIERGKALVVPRLGVFVIEEQPVRERHTHGVEARSFQQRQVITRDVLLAPLGPERARLIGADEVGDERFDVARRLRALPEVEHVAFGHEPVAETNAAA